MHQVGSNVLMALETALAAAARRFVREGRLAAAKADQRRGIEAICLRLGFPPAIAAAAGDGSADGATRAQILQRLEIETVALRRLARRADPAYDINRHIAVHRATKTLCRTEPGAGSARPPSGADLNARFRKRKGARHRSAPRPFLNPASQRTDSPPL